MDKFAMDDIDFGLLAGDGIATRAVKAGAVIFQEGDKADGLFIIKSGLVGIRLGNRSLAELNANSIFGEMALIDDAPRSATAVAVTDVELVPVSEKQFLFLVSQTPFFALKVDARIGATAARDQQIIQLVRFEVSGFILRDGRKSGLLAMRSSNPSCGNGAIKVPLD